MISTAEKAARARSSWRSRARFWVIRYGPAEAACLVTMLAASAIAASITDSPPLLAASAIAGATIGFYGVLLEAVIREQLRVVPAGSPARARRTIVRATALLAAEFGVAEVLDTFLLRPALMMAGVVLIGHPVWGLLAGKLCADVLFYVISGLFFRATERSGVRTATPSPMRRRTRRPAIVGA